MEIPSIRASPAVGRRTPASMRRVVVLPAQSGPTRPNSSPRPTSKLTPATAVWSPNLRVRPSTRRSKSDMGLSPYRRLHLRQPDVGRQAGLELVGGVLEDAHLDGIDQLHPLLGGLHVLGRELGLGGDVGDLALVGLAGIGVRGDGGAAPQVDRAHAVLLDVDAHPAVSRIDQRQHGGAGGHDLPRLAVAHGHQAVEGRREGEIVEHYSGGAQGGRGLGELGPRLVDALAGGGGGGGGGGGRGGGRGGGGGGGGGGGSAPSSFWVPGARATSRAVLALS